MIPKMGEAMRTSLGFILVALLAAPLMASEPSGTVPRNSAVEYPAHTKASGVAIGARALTPKQVHHIFTTDLNHCCLVVEVAIYPSMGHSLNVSLNDFALQIGSGDHAVKASSAQLLAAQLQQRNAKAASNQTGVTVYPEANVGYESGIDPITGRRIQGVTYGVGVGVGVGRNSSVDPNLPARPASTPADRKVMALELGAKGLPQGMTAVPVAGYIYFSLSKRDMKAVHHLDYTLDGKKLSLKLN